MGSIFSSISNAVKSIWNGIKNVAEKTYNYVCNAAAYVSQATHQVIQKVTKYVNAKIGGFSTTFVKPISLVSEGIIQGVIISFALCIFPIAFLFLSIYTLSTIIYGYIRKDRNPVPVPVPVPAPVPVPVPAPVPIPVINPINPNQHDLNKEIKEKPFDHTDKFLMDINSYIKNPQAHFDINPKKAYYYTFDKNGKGIQKKDIKKFDDAPDDQDFNLNDIDNNKVNKNDNNIKNEKDNNNINEDQKDIGQKQEKEFDKNYREEKRNKDCVKGNINKNNINDIQKKRNKDDIKDNINKNNINNIQKKRNKDDIKDNINKNNINDIQEERNKDDIKDNINKNNINDIQEERNKDDIKDNINKNNINDIQEERNKDDIKDNIKNDNLNEFGETKYVNNNVMTSLISIEKYKNKPIYYLNFENQISNLDCGKKIFKNIENNLKSLFDDYKIVYDDQDQYGRKVEREKLEDLKIKNMKNFELIKIIIVKKFIN